MPEGYLRDMAAKIGQSSQGGGDQSVGETFYLLNQWLIKRFLQEFHCNQNWCGNRQ